MFCDLRVTTENPKPGRPAAPDTLAIRAPRRVLRPLLFLLLAAPALPLLAEPATVEPEAIAPATIELAVAAPELEVAALVPAADAAPANTRLPRAATAKPVPAAQPAAPAGGLRQKADAAANATLAALLPHLSGNDSLPLLDRSAMFAGDVSRLLAAYDLAQGVPAQSQPAEQGRVQQVLKAAMALIGTPYRWGGASTEGFDCSGLVGYVFRNTLGIELPRVSREMAAKPDAALIRDRSQLTPGDLVFFGLRGRVNHVGIYVGDGQFLHAPSRGKDVRVDRMDSGYWGNRFLQARRVEI
jgi:cell wall-associated NlpC family hydrolase